MYKANTMIKVSNSVFTRIPFGAIRHIKTLCSIIIFIATTGFLSAKDISREEWKTIITQNQKNYESYLDDQKKNPPENRMKHLARCATSFEEFKMELKRANLNLKEEIGHTLLEIAVHTNSCAGPLISSKVTKDKKNINLNITYHVQSVLPDPEIVELLLDKGVDPKDRSYLVQAVNGGHLEVSRLLANEGATISEGDQQTPLLQDRLKEIARNGEKGWIPILNKGKVDLGGRDFSLLYFAIDGGYSQFAIDLLDAGANPNTYSVDDTSGFPLRFHILVKNKDVSLRKKLLEKGLDINTGKPSSEPPLFAALATVVQGGTKKGIEIATGLLEMGADPFPKPPEGQSEESWINIFKYVSSFSFTPAHKAFIDRLADRPEASKRIHNAVCDSAISPNRYPLKGMPAASLNSYYTYLEVLAKKDKFLNDKCVNEDGPPLHRAINVVNLRAMKILVNAGAQTKEIPSTSYYSPIGELVLSHSVWFRDVGAVAWSEALRLLLSKGASLQSPTNEEFTSALAHAKSYQTNLNTNKKDVDKLIKLLQAAGAK